jgi:hypothetical protein
MKNLYITASLCLALALTTVARADSFDSDAATIQKKTDKTATVMVDKSSYVVPISFGDGADWSSVKDHYELSDASVALLKKGHAKLTVGSDGSASWSK